jgi:hypothetical protein
MSAALRHLHRHRGVGAHSCRVQQHCRAEAKPWRTEYAANCPGVPIVSIFALTAHDAATVFEVAADFLRGRSNGLVRVSPQSLASFGPRFRFGVPPSSDLEFFGDKGANALFNAAIGMLEAVGGAKAEALLRRFATRDVCSTTVPGSLSDYTPPKLC